MMRKIFILTVLVGTLLFTACGKPTSKEVTTDTIVNTEVITDTVTQDTSIVVE